MIKPKILIIQTGGTIGQEKGPDGIFRPSEKIYLDKIPKINEFADITVERLMNIDSTNMETSHRAILAKKIYANHKKYDGFVIVHGTDTMVDTAAALNYMVQNLGKPIVLTGSQISIFEPGSDARTNLFYAIKSATMDLGEVVIVFGDKIIRGGRAVKENENGFNAFSSPRVQPLGEIGINIKLREHRIKRYKGKPILFTEFNNGIEFYQQTSGSQTKILAKYAEDNDVQGVVLGGFGAGNVQDRLISQIEKLIKVGKPVLITTICQLGSAEMGIYSVGLAALKSGAISAVDMTMGAAIQKLMYAIGMANKKQYTLAKKLEFVKKIIQKNYSNDISIC